MNQADLYADAAPSEAPAAEPQGAERESTGQTTLIPANVLGDTNLKPGDTLTMRVVEMTEDGALVEPEGTGETEEPVAPESQSAESPMASMME